MDNASLYAEDHHWGDGEIDILARDLPALKARFLLRNLPVAGRVLEVGCGGGRILNTIAAHRPGLELYGCDIRPLQAPPERFQFKQVSLSDASLPYPAESFDLVLMFDFLEHVVDPSRTLHDVREVLKPGGRLVSFTPLEGQRVSFYRLFRRLFGDDLYVRTKEHLHAYSEAELRTLVEREFEVIRHAYAYHFLGHLMDATLFALLKIPALRDRFWQSNPYYEEGASAGRAGRSPSILSGVLRFANAVAHAESRALGRVPQGAAGLLFVAVRR